MNNELRIIFEKLNLISINNDSIFYTHVFTSILRNVNNYIDKRMEQLRHNNIILNIPFFSHFKDYQFSNSMIPYLSYSWNSPFEENIFEINSLFDNIEDARHEALIMLDLFKSLAKDLFAIPLISGRSAYEDNDIDETYLAVSYLNNGVSKFFESRLRTCDNSNINILNSADKKLFYVNCKFSTNALLNSIIANKINEDIVFSPMVAPIQFVIIPHKCEKEGVMKASKMIYENLLANNYRANLDDSTIKSANKEAFYQSIGVPFIIKVTSRELKLNQITLLNKYNFTITQLNMNDLLTDVHIAFKDLHKLMYKSNFKFLVNSTKIINAIDELDTINIEDKGLYKTMICNSDECIMYLKKASNNSVVLMPFNQESICKVCPICGQLSQKLVMFSHNK